MKLIEPNVELIPQGEGLLGVYKMIEIAGRTCYKSEDKITDNSCKEFVQRMINSGHTAMLEHGSIYLKVPIADWQIDRHEWEYMFPKDLPWVCVDWDCKFVYISTNYRHTIEHEVGDTVLNKYLCAPTKFHERRITVRFTCDRGVSHELVRHRVFSFAQESTRYCNYSKDKFGNELTFIIPSWLELNEGEYYKEGSDIIGDGFIYNMQEGGEDTDTALFIYSLLATEKSYLALLDMGWKPQQARQILPNALKTEVVMTGFIDDWKHFFELRCAPNAHPDMQALANKLKELFNQNNYI